MPFCFPSVPILPTGQPAESGARGARRNFHEPGIHSVREGGSAPKRGGHSTICVSTKCICAVAALCFDNPYQEVIPRSQIPRSTSHFSYSAFATLRGCLRRSPRILRRPSLLCFQDPPFFSLRLLCLCLRLCFGLSPGL